MRRHPTRLASLLAAAVIVATACGAADVTENAADNAAENAGVQATASAAPGGTSGSAEPGTRPVLPVTNVTSPFPAVTVRDVVRDEWVQFADVLPAERPVLLWFWAPF